MQTEVLKAVEKLQLLFNANDVATFTLMYTCKRLTCCYKKLSVNLMSLDTYFSRCDSLLQHVKDVDVRPKECRLILLSYNARTKNFI